MVFSLGRGSTGLRRKSLRREDSAKESFYSSTTSFNTFFSNFPLHDSQV
jgi:hypothetical protein